jgi:hypothetical protein
MVGDVLTTDTIDKTTLCLADNLQRFRFMIKDGLTEEEATIKCQEMAKTWHADNADSLAKLKESKKLEILTWDEFLNWSEYDHTMQQVESLYKSNRTFRKEVDGRLRQEFKNIQADAKLTDPQQQAELLKRYLLEECAWEKFAASKRFDYEAYKNPFSPAMRYIKNNNDFVPYGLMIELYFTQFNPTKSITNDFVSKENGAYSPIFSKKPIKYQQESESCAAVKISEFIEKTIRLLPTNQQEKAAEALFKFTTQEIIPMYYQNATNTLKI